MTLTSQEKMKSSQFYCVKCKRKFRQSNDDRICVVKLKNHRAANKTTCTACDTTCYRFISVDSTPSMIQEYGLCNGRSKPKSKCHSGEVRSRSTGRCRSPKKRGRKARSEAKVKCRTSQVRSRSTGHCRSKKKPGRKARSKSKSKCRTSQVRSRSTGRCRSKKKAGRKARSKSKSKCRASQVRSRSTGRCRSKKKPGRKARA